LLIHAHGNAELIQHWLFALQPYREMGISVALLEYRGYGRSQGVPSEAAILKDLESFLAQLKQRPEINPEAIIYHGRSLGGGVLGAFSGRQPPKALILESTFRSVPLMARKMGVPAFLIKNHFNTEAVLKELQAPLLIFHGVQDDLIPFEHAEALAQANPKARLRPLQCGHNDCPPDPVAYWREIWIFLKAAKIPLNPAYQPVSAPRPEGE